MFHNRNMHMSHKIKIKSCLMQLSEKKVLIFIILFFSLMKEETATLTQSLLGLDDHRNTISFLGKVLKKFKHKNLVKIGLMIKLPNKTSHF